MVALIKCFAPPALRDSVRQAGGHLEVCLAKNSPPPPPTTHNAEDPLDVAKQSFTLNTCHTQQRTSFSLSFQQDHIRR